MKGQEKDLYRFVSVQNQTSVQHAAKTLTFLTCLLFLFKQIFQLTKMKNLLWQGGIATQRYNNVSMKQFGTNFGTAVAGSSSSSLIYVSPFRAFESHLFCHVENRMLVQVDPQADIQVHLPLCCILITFQIYFHFPFCGVISVQSTCKKMLGWRGVDGHPCLRPRLLHMYLKVRPDAAVLIESTLWKTGCWAR